MYRIADKEGVDSEEYMAQAPSGVYNTAPADSWRQGADQIWQSFCCQCNLQVSCCF